jgi:NAD(P)-dependent dehydrogenase (short-subunit alcohol dehydrogenase family)
VIAKHGPAVLILAGRSQAKCVFTPISVKDPLTRRFGERNEESASIILAESPTASLRHLVLDLSSLAAVRVAAAEVNAYAESVDVLINNAGVMACPYGTTVDGFETQFGTNHLGTFLFTNLIRPRLAPGARIVNVSSRGHKLGPVRFDDIDFQKGATYDKWEAYGQAKTANMLFSVGLAKR